MVDRQYRNLAGVEMLNGGLTIVIECLIMATECTLSINSGNSAIIAAGGIAVFWMLA